MMGKGTHFARVVALLCAMVVAPGIASSGVPSAAASTARDFAPIQPGALIPGSECTLGFVFRDDVGRLYIGTAGHCVAWLGVGGVVRQDGQRIGELVFVDSQSYRPDDFRPFYPDDFGLIRIDEDRYDDVSPMVRYWGGPTGVATPGEHEPGELVSMYGHGQGIRESGLLARQGILTDLRHGSFSAAYAVSAGDSGGPLLSAESGEAIGMINTMVGPATSPGTVSGPTVPRAIELAASVGLDIELVTAPLPYEDIPDQRDCENRTAAPVTHHYQSLDDPTDADVSNADRFAVCVIVSDYPAAYAGGEVQPEHPTSPNWQEFGEFCGSIKVLSYSFNHYSEGRDWHNPGPDGEWGTDDDHTCD